MNRLRMLPRGRLVAGLALLGLVLFPVLRPYSPTSQLVLMMAFLLGVQAVGWNIISGYAGYISLGHSVFLGLGSYTVGILAARFAVNPFLLAPLGGVTAAVAALLIGLVVLRTSGHAFVIITIALLLAAQVLAVNFRSLTNGSDGITLPLPSWSRDIQNVPFYFAFLLLLVLAVLFSGWIRRTKFGTGLVAIREDEGKAAAIGVNTTRYKVLAYMASAFLIGVGGGVYAYFLTFLNPLGAFNILASVTIVLSALAGGRGTLYGPVVGAFLVQFGSEAATRYAGGSQSRVLLFGTALVLVVLFLPAGLLPTLQSWWRRRHPREIEYIDHAGALAGGPVRVLERAAAAPAVAGESPMLEVRGAVKRFGGLVAVDGADLAVPRGSVTGLIGPNGSGKTTLFNLITGGLRPDAGEILLAGRRLDRLPPWQRGHLGLARTFQTTRLFRSMTVLENVVAPLPDSRWRNLVAGSVSGPEAERARDLLDFVGLARFAGQPAGALSYGQQKLVELAQVLMLEPSLVLLDEPAGGVNPSLVGRIVEIVRQLNRAGMTFLVVEHDIPLVLELCDPVVVFSRGRAIATGPPGEIRGNPLVLDAYLGDDWRPPAAAGPVPAGGTDAAAGGTPVPGSPAGGTPVPGSPAGAVDPAGQGRT